MVDHDVVVRVWLDPTNQLLDGRPSLLGRDAGIALNVDDEVEKTAMEGVVLRQTLGVEGQLRFVRFAWLDEDQIRSFEDSVLFHSIS